MGRKKIEDKITRLLGYLSILFTRAVCFASIGVICTTPDLYLPEQHYYFIYFVIGVFLGGGCSCEKAHIAYGVIIAILVLIIIALLVFICRRKRGKSREAEI